MIKVLHFLDEEFSRIDSISLLPPKSTLYNQTLMNEVEKNVNELWQDFIIDASNRDIEVFMEWIEEEQSRKDLLLGFEFNFLDESAISLSEDELANVNQRQIVEREKCMKYLEKKGIKYILKEDTIYLVVSSNEDEQLSFAMSSKEVMRRAILYDKHSSM